MKFRNSTMFFVPLCFADYNKIIGSTKADCRWADCTNEDNEVDYLLYYVKNVITDRSLFSSFILRKQDIPDVYMFEKEAGLKEKPLLTDVRISFFSTGIGFLEYRVEYEDMTPQEITDFSYYFKKATKAEKHNLPDVQIGLNKASKAILPAGCDIDLFFTSTAEFKYECHCFHTICLEKDRYSDEEQHDFLKKLRRSYNSGFESQCDMSEYDMIYCPYDSDKWAGSQEGIVNLVSRTGNDRADYFVDNYKYFQLVHDYRIMYIMLLNQRYSAIKYIYEVSRSGDYSQKKAEELNRKIVRLKTTFSFRVISDDLIYQNVYSKMYRILDIDNLMEDVKENEEQMSIIQSARAMKQDDNIGRILAALSILSIFSALIDLAGFLDRFPLSDVFSTIFSIFSVVGIVTASIIFIWKKR